MDYNKFVLDKYYNRTILKIHLHGIITKVLNEAHYEYNKNILYITQKIAHYYHPNRDNQYLELSLNNKGE